jgi:hypothetical protein
MNLAWRTVFGCIPVPIVYVAALGEGRGGETRGPVVRIASRYRDPLDEGLHQHELEHVRQFWRLPIVHSLLYATSKRYRLRSEAGAYRIQMRWPDGRGGALPLEEAAWYLATEYRLDVSVDEARRAILRHGTLDGLNRIA